MRISFSQTIFTTKFVVEDNSPIIYVSHDEEGDWQFFGPEDNVEIECARIVTLGEILEMDPSLEEILGIPLNSEAYREKVGGNWKVMTNN